jgi:hypothetical protein
MTDTIRVRPLLHEQCIEVRITNGTINDLDGRSAGSRLAWITDQEALLLIQQLASSVGRLQTEETIKSER